MGSLRLGPADGRLSVHTGVAGGAARVGHSLVIDVSEWAAEVSLAHGEPSAVLFTAAVDSLEVKSGSDGLRPLSKREMGMIHDNAMRSLRVKKHPEIRFESDSVSRGPDTVSVAGTLTIAGRHRGISADLTAADQGDRWQLGCVVPITQSDFGIKPYSLMGGMLKVADDVQVHLNLDIPADRL